MCVSMRACVRAHECVRLYVCLFVGGMRVTVMLLERPLYGYVAAYRPEIKKKIVLIKITGGWVFWENCQIENEITYYHVNSLTK